MSRLSGILGLILIGSIVMGQNLVSNPSFEEVTEITNRWSGTHFDFNRRMKEWNSPTQGSVDILYVQSLDKMHPPRPMVDLSDHLPRTGKFMVGLKTYGCATQTSHCKEYLQIKLKEPLQPGERYAIEYWVNPIAPSVKVNGFGVAVSTRKSEDFWQTQVIDLKPIITNVDILDGQPNEWQCVSGMFTSDDKYAYLIIGNFGSDLTMNAKFEPEGLDYGYYLLDDVQLTHIPRAEKPALVTNKVVVLENILFDFDKAELQEVSRAPLDELATYLLSHPDYGIDIMGHTDAEGGAAYNLTLSQQRADAIAQYLILGGVEEARISPKGLGNAFPVLGNDSEENRRMNRRVEIRIITE